MKYMKWLVNIIPKNQKQKKKVYWNFNVTSDVDT